MNPVDQKWIDQAKAYVERYNEAVSDLERESLLLDLVADDLAITEAMVQYCAGIIDWMEPKAKEAR